MKNASEQKVRVLGDKIRREIAKPALAQTANCDSMEAHPAHLVERDDELERVAADEDAHDDDEHAGDGAVPPGPGAQGGAAAGGRGRGRRRRRLSDL